MAVRGNVNKQDPGYDAVAVTPSDTAQIEPCRGLYIGGAGDVKVQMASGTGTAVTFAGLLAGSILPVQVQLVYSTDTTATNIVALY